MSHVSSELHSHDHTVALQLIEEGQRAISDLIVGWHDLHSGQPLRHLADQPMIDAVCKRWTIYHDFAALAVK